MSLKCNPVCYSDRANVVNFSILTVLMVLLVIVNYLENMFVEGRALLENGQYRVGNSVRMILVGYGLRQ